MIRWINAKIFRNIFKLRPLRESFKIAIAGIGYLFVFHRNMRIIFLLGILAFLSGVYLELRGIELVVLCLTIMVVFMAEMFNTAIEIMMDMLKDEYHIRIKLIKDISAAVVLLSALNAIAVGAILFIKKLPKLWYQK